MKLNAAGQVVVKLKTPWRDGITHLEMSPPEFLQKQVALAPFLRRPALGCSRDASCERPLRGDHSKVVSVSEGSIAGLREQRLTGSTIHETGLPQSGHSPPAPLAALLSFKSTGQMTAMGHIAVTGFASVSGS